MIPLGLYGAATPVTGAVLAVVGADSGYSLDPPAGSDALIFISSTADRAVTSLSGAGSPATKILEDSTFGDTWAPTRRHSVWWLYTPSAGPITPTWVTNGEGSECIVAYITGLPGEPSVTTSRAIRGADSTGSIGDLSPSGSGGVLLGFVSSRHPITYTEKYGYETLLGAVPRAALSTSSQVPMGWVEAGSYALFNAIRLGA